MKEIMIPIGCAAILEQLKAVIECKRKANG